MPILSGTVEISGIIDLNQFYYRGGKSDADTVKLELSVESVKFKDSDDAAWQENLEVYHEALVRGKPIIDSNERMTIRLQGVDATELHYVARRDISEKDMTQEQKDHWNNGQFRQKYSAKATHKFTNFLAKYEEVQGLEYIRATFVSKVDEPDDLIDVYGRAVGNIILKDENGNTEDANHWLVKEGWAFPAFYNSMSKDEINTILAFAKDAEANGKGMWPDYSADIVPFDPNLRLPKKHEPLVEIDEDTGPIIFPKIFRRQVYYEVNKRAKVNSFPTLKEYLVGKNKRDPCHTLEDFLKDGDSAERKNFTDLIDNSDTFTKKPYDVVFVENDSKIVDHLGNALTEWF